MNDLRRELEVQKEREALNNAFKESFAAAYPPGRLALPSVTLICVEALEAPRAIASMLRSTRVVDFGETALITTHIGMRNALPRPCCHAYFEDSLSGPRINYEMYQLTKLSQHIAGTHCLFHEWDSGVVNPSTWRDEWLQYDFIGAPWPYPYTEPNYPPCDVSNCVGNGGFSLRSKKLCEAVASLVNAPSFHNSGQASQFMRVSDALICRTFRPMLEHTFGCVFAPYSVAERFSCENSIYSGQWGYHGKTTIAMNGWKLDALKIV